jgi:hypothetical protein
MARQQQKQQCGVAAEVGPKRLMFAGVCCAVERTAGSQIVEACRNSVYPRVMCAALRPPRQQLPQANFTQRCLKFILGFLG